MLSGPIFTPVRCGVGFYPLDELLKLSERRKQVDVQKAGASLTAEVPYEMARSAFFRAYRTYSYSDHTIHGIVNEVTQEVGVLDISPSKGEIASKTADVADKKSWRPILVLAIDGAHVPTRPEAAKGRRCGRKKIRAKRARMSRRMA